ncbi:MAG TPA: VWA domain-containing protein [Beijerinckiaceae bacterium]|nr:VWA domain-containing protein [Beijerinckiaceae bacterium]
MTRYFGRDARGSVALIFAVALVPVLGAAAAALDYSNASRKRGELQVSLDAAVLAAAVSPLASDAERIRTATGVFSSKYRAGAASLTVSVTSGKVVGRAREEVPGFLAGLMGRKSNEVAVEAEALVAEQGIEAEIALVLDFSGSMNRNGKYLAMRDAATSFIEGVIARDPARKSRISLVPFSEYVFAAMPTDFLEDVNPTWWGRTVEVCLDGRQHPAAVDGTVPRAADETTKWEAVGLPPEYYKPQAESTRASRAAGRTAAGGEKTAIDEKNQTVALSDALCAEYASRNLKLQPLTSDLRGLIAALRAMTPVKMTNISLGLELGWHTLTSEVPFPGGSPDSAGKTKFIVLLTDGEQTSPGHGPGGSFNVAQADKNTEELCKNIKKKGIRIATVAFQLESVKAKKLVEDCASSPDLFFDAQKNSDLTPIFTKISAQLHAVARLVK